MFGGQAIRIGSSRTDRRPALQILGGRGFMRENCAERFTRELRVDRIWEGASEVQRLVIANALKKRGLDGM